MPNWLSLFLEHIAKAPDYTNAVPVEVELTPIDDLCDAKDTILVNIGDTLTQKTAKMLRLKFQSIILIF